MAGIAVLHLASSEVQYSHKERDKHVGLVVLDQSLVDGTDDGVGPLGM